MAKEGKHGGKLKWIILIVVIVIILIALGGGGDDKPKKVSSDSGKETTSETAKSDASEKEESNKKDDTFTLGDTAEYDGIQVKLSSAALSNGDGEFVKPDDGKYFLGLVFEINNQSSKDINISSVVSFEAYCDDYSLNQDIVGLQAPQFKGLGQLDGSVAAGKKMSGVICYQVPQDFKSFEISCTPDFWGSHKVTFEFNRDKVDASAIGQ